jgi:hypothetical protein
MPLKLLMMTPPSAPPFHEPMRQLRKGHGFVELNYPHIIDISGYERHHDMATCAT